MREKIINKVQNHDCCFVEGSGIFRYRAAAIIIEDDCVLLASNRKTDYYYSVGGGVHMGESSEDAVVREVYEETGIKYEVDRLAFVHENFFVENGQNWHEIAFYYLMKSRGTQELNSNSTSQGVKEYMNWIPISELKNHSAYPIFFIEKLLKISNQVEHIISIEK